MDLEVLNINEGPATFVAAIISGAIGVATLIYQIILNKRQNKANRNLERLKIQIAEESQRSHFKFAKYHELQLESTRPIVTSLHDLASRCGSLKRLLLKKECSFKDLQNALQKLEESLVKVKENLSFVTIYIEENIGDDTLTYLSFCQSIYDDLKAKLDTLDNKIEIFDTCVLEKEKGQLIESSNLFYDITQDYKGFVRSLVT